MDVRRMNGPVKATLSIEIEGKTTTMDDYSLHQGDVILSQKRGR